MKSYTLLLIEEPQGREAVVILQPGESEKDYLDDGKVIARLSIGDASSFPCSRRLVEEA